MTSDLLNPLGVLVVFHYKSMSKFDFHGKVCDVSDAPKSNDGGDPDFNSSSNVVRNDKGGQVIGFLSKL